MIKRNQVYLNRLNALSDFLLVFFSYIFSAWFRLRVLHGWYENRGLSRPMILASLFYAAGLLVVLSIFGFYSSNRIKRLSWKIGTLFISITITIFIVTAVIFAFKVENVSRGIILLFYLLTIFLLGGKQVVIRAILDYLRSSGHNIRHEILIGAGKLAMQYREDILNEPELGIQIDRILKPGAELIAILDKLLPQSEIDEVVIALEPEEYTHITSLIAACEKNGVRYFVIPFYNDMIPAHPVFERIGRTRLVNMRANSLEQIGWAILKRSFDIFASAVGLLVLSPVLLIVAMGVKLSSPGPIFFRQVRVGYNRRQFQMLKFRSMRVNNTSDTAW